MSSCKIRNWNVSYYQNNHQRWVYGQLTCSPYDVRFHMKSVGRVYQSIQGDHHQAHPADTTVSAEMDDLILQYADIKQVQKATSMWVFPAVTVQANDGTVHWFSSLPDHHSVYNTLDYFSRHSLLNSERNAPKPASTPSVQTHLGQQLLRSAEDSERTLASAAADLHAQGRQLDRASVTLMEMHEDLDAADRLLSGLDTYLGQWTLPPQYTQSEIIHVSKDEIPTTEYDLEVLSSELRKDQWRTQQLSFLRVTESALVVLNSRQHPLHTFRMMELSRVFVVSPWEVVVTKHVAGRTSVSVSIVSSELLPVLRLMEKKVSHLMDYNRTEMSHSTSCKRESETVSHRGSAGTKILSANHTLSAAEHLSHTHRPGAGCTQRGSQDCQSSPCQKAEQTQMQQVSTEEVSALCDRLESLKSMAKAVGEELTAQNAALDDMITSVDRADLRIRDATQRTKKLM